MVIVCTALDRWRFNTNLRQATIRFSTEHRAIYTSYTYLIQRMEHGGATEMENGVKWKIGVTMQFR